MAILMNNVKSNNNEAVVEARGFAANQAMRNAVVKALYETSIVIRKFKITVDDEDNATVVPYFGTIGMNPVAVAFGLDYNKRIANLEVEVKTELDKEEPRRINVDGQKYIYCSSLVTIECEDSSKIEEYAAEGFAFTDEDGNENVYRVAGSSPSNEKHATKFYYRVTDKIDTELKAFNIMDKVSGYVFSAKFGKLMTGKAVTKLNTRLGNYLTTMKSLAQIDLAKDYIAIVHEERDENGKTTKEGSIVGAHDFDEETMKQMKKVGISIDNHINDGANYYATDVIIDMAKAVGAKMNHKDALKVAVQNRATYVTGKTMSRTLTKGQLELIAKANNAEYYGNRNGRLLAIFDEDGAKLINKQALKNEQPVIDIYVMAVAKASTVRTSGQHLIKYMSINEEATLKFMKETAANKVNEFVLDKLNNDKPAMNSVNARIIAALGEKATENKALMETIIQDTINYATSAVAKTKLDIDGVYSHMMFDLTYALTEGRINNILGITKDGFVEAYSVDVLRMYKDEIAAIEDNEELTDEEKDEQLFQLLSGVVIKYPSAMPNEFEIIVYLTKKQIERRIKAITNNDDKKTLREYFNNTPYGCTVYAPVNAMKNKLAGADVDFDATMTDMSALKFILIDQRIKEQNSRPGFMGYCTFISYKNIDRTGLSKVQADEQNL